MDTIIIGMWLSLLIFSVGFPWWLNRLSHGRLLRAVARMLAMGVPSAPEAGSGPVTAPSGPAEAAPDEECGTCVHFDLEAGQKVQNDYPLFKAASAIIPPHVMGVPVDEHGNPTVAPDMRTLKTSWGDVGLCTVPDDQGNRELVAARCVGCPKGMYERRLSS